MYFKYTSTYGRHYLSKHRLTLHERNHKPMEERNYGCLECIFRTDRIGEDASKAYQYILLDAIGFEQTTGSVEVRMQRLENGLTSRSWLGRSACIDKELPSCTGRAARPAILIPGRAFLLASTFKHPTKK